MSTTSSSDVDHERSRREGTLLLAVFALLGLIALARMALLAAGQDVRLVLTGIAYGILVIWIPWFVAWAFFGGVSRLRSRTDGT